MANYIATETDITSIANAIRTQTGGSSTLAFPTDFITAIASIPATSTADGNITSADVVSGKIGYAQGNKITGAMATYTETAPLPLNNITATVTNLTASADNEIAIGTGETVTLTYTADGTTYVTPTTAPTVTGATGVYTRVSSTTCTITLSSATGDVSYSIAGEQEYPGKGELVTLYLGNMAPSSGTNNLYRIISISGSIAEVVALYCVSDSCAYNSSQTHTYTNGELDTLLNTTFYNSLSTTAKSAIVTKNITIYSYDYDREGYDADTHASYADYSSKSAVETVGSRYVYTLSIDDIETYFNSSFGTTDIWQMLWNTSTSPSSIKQPWVRDVSTTSSRKGWAIDGDIWETYCDLTYAVRPVFKIDLSMLDEWEYPTQSGTNLSITQTYSATQSGVELIIQ